MTFEAVPPPTPVGVAVLQRRGASVSPAAPSSRRSGLPTPGHQQPADRELLVPGKLPGHRLEHESSHRRDVHGESARRESSREATRASRSPYLGRSLDACPPGTSHRRADQATLLLRDLDRDEPPAALPQRVAAELTQGVAYAAEQVCVLFDKELHAGVAARFLVAREREDDVAGGTGLRRRRPHQRRKQHRHAALHVKGASPPDLAVDQIATERRMSPLARVRRNNVDMAVQEKRRRLAPTLRHERRGWVDRPRPPGTGAGFRRARVARLRTRCTLARFLAGSTCRTGSTPGAARPH